MLPRSSSTSGRALLAGAIEYSPLGYLRTLVARWQEGDMGLRYAVS
jgi:hypothetical protein